MAITVSFNFPVNADAVRQRDAICGRNGYQAFLPDPQTGALTVPNPETKEQFAKRMTREWWKSETRKWELQQQAAATEATYTDIGVTD